MDNHNPPQENLTSPPDEWSPRQNLDELRQLPNPILPLVPQPNSRLPPATNHSHGDNTMTTHSVTQTRQSMETRTPTARPHIPTDPARGLEILFGDTTQPTPTEESTLPYRPEVIGPSHSQRTNTTREAQTSHPIPNETDPIIQFPASQGTYTIPNHTLVDNLARVGEDLFQQTHFHDRPRQHLGLGYNQGDGWDHSHLDLVGNRVIQDQRLVHRSDRVMRFHPTHQTEDWSSRIATITHVHPTLWTNDEGSLVRSALDAMLRGAPTRHNIGGSVRTLFRLQGQKDFSDSASSSDMEERQHSRSQSHSREHPHKNPPRGGLSTSHRWEQNRMQRQHSQNLQPPHLQLLQDQNTLGRHRIPNGTHASDQTSNQHQKQQKNPGQGHNTSQPYNNTQGRNSERPRGEHSNHQTSGATTHDTRAGTHQHHQQGGNVDRGAGESRGGGGGGAGGGGGDDGGGDDEDSDEGDRDELRRRSNRGRPGKNYHPGSHDYMQDLAHHMADLAVHVKSSGKPKAVQTDRWCIPKLQPQSAKDTAYYTFHLWHRALMDLAALPGTNEDLLLNKLKTDLTILSQSQ